jgi:hypothetical protein
MIGDCRRSQTADSEEVRLIVDPLYKAGQSHCMVLRLVIFPSDFLCRLFHGVLLDTSFLFFITCSDGRQDTTTQGRRSPEDQARDKAVNSWTSFTLQVSSDLVIHKGMQRHVDNTSFHAIGITFRARASSFCLNITFSVLCSKHMCQSIFQRALQHTSLTSVELCASCRNLLTPSIPSVHPHTSLPTPL